MTYTAGPTQNLQQWLNKYVPELQTKPVQPPTGTQATDQLTLKAEKGESVSISSDGKMLSDAAHSQYQSHHIDPEQLKKGCHALYEKGCITAEEFGRITGEKLPHDGNISKTMDFLSSFIEIESLEGDVEGARMLSSALDVLRNLESPMTALKAGQERQAVGYVHEYRDLLQDTGADAELIHEFDRVVNVFDALSSSREQARQGVVTTYASLSAQLRSS